MTARELPVLFGCGADELVGIISRPAQLAVPTGVLVIVGGPQYRIGSHRQFVLLSRELCRLGAACMRFDYRGMGDATGAARSFQDVGDDIRAAIDVFLRKVPGLERVVLWGLCDGASAACLYAPDDARIAGLILLNPWVRTEAGEAKTMLRHHYLKRLTDGRFWARLVSGDVAIGEALRGIAGAAGKATRGVTAGASATGSLPERMAHCVARSGTPFALALSGRDYVAREFEGALGEAQWAALARGAQCIGVERWELADHTFSSAAWRQAVADMSVRWLSALDERARGGVVSEQSVQ